MSFFSRQNNPYSSPQKRRLLIWGRLDFNLHLFSPLLSRSGHGCRQLWAVVAIVFRRLMGFFAGSEELRYVRRNSSLVLDSQPEQCLAFCRAQARVPSPHLLKSTGSQKRPRHHHLPVQNPLLPLHHELRCHRSCNHEEP